MKTRKTEFQAVHYIIPDTWELEELTLADPFPYPGTMGSTCLTENCTDVVLLVSDVASRPEFETILATRGLKIGRKKRPYNNKMELFVAEAL